MDEVSCQTVALVVDGLTHRGLSVATFLEDMPETRARLADARGRIDWEEWVTLLARIEDALGGPDEMEQLFVPRAGVRTGHVFVRLANSFLGVEDLYRLIARWGLTRQLMVMRGRFESFGGGRARLSVTIDPTRVGSAPTLRFTTGIVRALPGLQGQPHAEVTSRIDSHSAVYDIAFPRGRSLGSRVRHMLGVVGGAQATLAELEAQSEEISVKNAALQSQVTDLAKAESSLRERDEWLQLALDAGKIGIWSWDAKTGAPRLSPSLYRLSGVAVDSPTTLLVEHIHPDDREVAREAFRATRETGVPMDVEYRVQPPAGGVAWLRATGRAVRDASGAVERVIGTLADITERKHLETRIRFADRLIAAGTLAAGVAHEINNPLAFVLANTEYLRARTRALGEDAVVFDQLLAESADGLLRIRDIVRDLRTFARPQEEHVSVVDLREVADVALRIAAHELRHRARVETDYADGPVRVRANESRLGQVMMNLLINAAHAMPARPQAESLIRLRVGTGDAGTAVVEVEDNGEGIAPDVLPRVFDPFFTTKPLGEGTGLGLPVCQGIVETLGGRIDVESTLGRGSTFRVSLPLARGSEPEARAPVVRRSLAGQRVLLIDDEPLVRRSVARLLASEGCDVVAADGGRAGLALALSDGAFDAVLCDLMMPDLSGMDLYAELATARPELARRTVFLTGGAVTDRARRFLAESPRPCLDKPFRLAQLLDALGAG